MKIKGVIDSLKEGVAPKYQCCFCGQAIAKNALVKMNLDLGDDQSQFMAAHGLCIQNKLHASVPFLAPEDMQDD